VLHHSRRLRSSAADSESALARAVNVGWIRRIPKRGGLKMKLRELRNIATLIFLAAISACKQNNNDSNGRDEPASSSGTPANTQNQTPAATTSNLTTQCIVQSSSSTVCFEYTGLPSAGSSIAKSSCDEERGTFKAGVGCPRQNAVGGCTQGGNTGDPTIKLVSWRYSPGVDANTVKSMCTSQGETYIAP